MTVAGIGGDSSLAELQRQLKDDVAQLRQDTMARADEQVIEVDQARVQMDQAQIALLLQRQQQDALRAAQEQQREPGPAADGGWYL